MHGFRRCLSSVTKALHPFTKHATYGLGFLAFAVGATAATASCAGIESAPKAESSSNLVDLAEKQNKYDELRPKDKGFVRIDKEVLESSADFFKNHALHSSLKGDSLVETFEVYLNPKTSDIHVVIHFGVGLNGHPTVVHGGILGLAFDESFGWLLFAGLKNTKAFTANLNVNYRKKVSEDTTVAIKGRLVEHNGRKLLMSASMVDRAENVLAEATALFITSRPEEKKENEN